MQQIHQNINWFLSSKTANFLKRSFLFALLSSTLLYILVRVFFYEFPFTIGEGFELYSKILLVLWIFIVVCKLVFTVIVLIENNISKITPGRMMYIPVLKKTILIALTAVLAYTGKTEAVDKSKMADSGNNSGDETAAGTENNFLVKMPV